MPYKDPEVKKQKNKEACARAYKNNKDEYKRKARERTVRLRNEFYEYKATLLCSRCGENPHPSAMEFHHRDPSVKKFNIGRGIAMGYSMDKIKAEIAKCDVLCANCHRIVEYEAT